jgi:hypothetical protein
MDSVDLQSRIDCRFVGMGIVMDTQQPITLAAPKITVPAIPADKWRREFVAFQRLRLGLLDRYSGQYVLIHDGQVADSGPDDLALALRFFARHGKVAVHIGLVTAEPETPIRIPHYRTTSVKETP